MNKLEILYSLTAMGYHFLLPEGPENLSDGRVRWYYTAYKCINSLILGLNDVKGLTFLVNN